MQNETYLGALIFSSVNTTSGAFPFGPGDLPRRITVSPLNTFLTRATPLEGRIIGGQETGVGVAVAVVAVEVVAMVVCSFSFLIVVCFTVIIL